VTKQTKMGQETSMIDLDTPSVTLSSRSLDAVADFIKAGRATRIVVMTGAGISTSAGIPDFRSPETGLYANLARLNLPYAEAVFDISYFREHPEPFYVLAKELYPGQFYPTVSHAFIALLNQKSLLRMLFTQNIDCLERRAGVPAEKIVEAHGSFATQRCIECRTEYPDDLMKQAVANGEVPHCGVPQCNGLVKPDIVFFGEPLPPAFHLNRDVLETADLVIVMGTSLSVHPFASLPQLAAEGVPRLLFNMEAVGDLGSRTDDVIVLGECDEGVRNLADALGWRDELEALWKSVGGDKRERELAALQEARMNMSKDELFEAEIAKLTGDIDKTLEISMGHQERVKADLRIKAEELQIDQQRQIKADIHEHMKKVFDSKAEAIFESERFGTIKPETEDISPISVKWGTPVNTGTLHTELSAHFPLEDPKAIVDVTLPHNRPEKDVSKPKTPTSHI
jgi:NAD-dependent histone deacetylase SIR2